MARHPRPASTSWGQEARPHKAGSTGDEDGHDGVPFERSLDRLSVAWESTRVVVATSFSLMPANAVWRGLVARATQRPATFLPCTCQACMRSSRLLAQC